MSSMLTRLKQFIELSTVQNGVIVLIILNAILLGLETVPQVMQQAGEYLILADRIILVIFVVEILIRLLVYRLSFWRDPWSLFDFTVVMIALIPASGAFAVLRALSTLR